MWNMNALPGSPLWIDHSRRRTDDLVLLYIVAALTPESLGGLVELVEEGYDFVCWIIPVETGIAVKEFSDTWATW